MVASSTALQYRFWRNSDARRASVTGQLSAFIVGERSEIIRRIRKGDERSRNEYNFSDGPHHKA